MILMWLGSLALMMFGFLSARAALREIFSQFTLSLFEKELPQQPVSSLLKASVFALLQPSPVQTQYGAISFLSLKKWGTRSSALMMCTSILGVAFILVLGFLFANLSGALLMGVGSFYLISQRLSKTMKAVLKLIFFCGLFLMGGEVALRSSSILQTLLGQSEFAFFLADGRFSAVLPLLFLALALSLIIDFEYWSFVLGLSLLLTNVVSMNGALAIVSGELVGRQVLLVIRTWTLEETVAKIARGFALVSVVGIILGFLFAGEARSVFGLGFTEDFTASQAKLFDFVTMIALVHAVWFLSVMVWGHFAGNKTYAPSDKAVYPPISWWDQGLFGHEVEVLQRRTITQRLSEIRYHLKGLETIDKAQIPGAIQARLVSEEKDLSVLDQRLRP